MIFAPQDFESSNNKNNKYDFAVIGAGAAGITISRKLSSKGKRVAMMEAGSYEFSEESQKIYDGKVLGDAYFDLSVCRLRHFGGSTNHWGGMCRSFEAIDFQRKYLGEEYQWPISKNDIDKYYSEACNILDIPIIKNDLIINNSNLREVYFEFSTPTNFREKYYNDFKSNSYVDVFLNANLIDINVNSGRISSGIFKSFNEKKLMINAKIFIFCMGGIENSRYLLFFKKKHGNNFINKNLPLGKYWMEHFHVNLGKIIIKKNKNLKRFFALQESFQEKLGILNCGIRVDNDLYSNNTKKLIAELACIAPKVGNKFFNFFNKNLVCSGNLEAAWEQSPILDNKITLDSQSDSFGVPKPILNWSRNSLDTKTLKQAFIEFNKWLLETDHGRVKLETWVIDNYNLDLSNVNGGNHHMGGTRMHSNSSFGVVDKNCKVHGNENLYIAGSSIFTTGGHNNPTLPIVQFALRLSEFLLK